MTMRKIDGVAVAAGKNGAKVSVYYGDDCLKIGTKGTPAHVTEFARTLPPGLRRQLRKSLHRAGHRDIVLAGL